MNIYVGNIPWSTDEDAVRELFEQYGAVDSVKLIKDRETGRLRGFGFVEMTEDDSARNAIEQLNQSDFGGRTLVVNEARPRDNRGGGGGGRRGGGGGGFGGGNW